MYMGIDLGTSGVKVALINGEGELLDTATSRLTVQQPQPLWSEQDPDSWWQATKEAISELSAGRSMEELKGISFSGQMHGATLIDDQGLPLRPCILWNDGRSYKECAVMEAEYPQFRHLTGNLVMPGFTAPKLVWLRENEPDIFASIDKVLLPKDYLRYRLTGEFYSDMSDASGTLWLDVPNRCWSDTLLDSTRLTPDHMPQVTEGNQPTGEVMASVARELGIPVVPVYAGAGDNAAGAIGSGIVNNGEAMLSLGTSGVYFVASNQFFAKPKSAVHSFCHALPERWHLMSVMLSAAACLEWAAGICNETDIGMLLQRVENNVCKTRMAQAPLFLPYLSGERTPHNNPKAKGVLFGLTHNHTTEDILYAVLEGVSFGLRQGTEVLHHTGASSTGAVRLIGGGARSPYWRQMLADICGKSMAFCEGGDVGPALGAARLARLGVEGMEKLGDICPAPKVVQAHEPDSRNADVLTPRYEHFQTLYQAVKESYKVSRGHQIVSPGKEPFQKGVFQRPLSFLGGIS